MIMLKLIEAKRFGDRNTINIEEYWQKTKSGSQEGKGEELDDKARFTQQVLNVALKEIESKNANHQWS